MPLPLIGLGLAAAGGGAGWLTGKAMEARGDAIKAEAWGIEAEVNRYINEKTEEYETTRLRFLRRLRSMAYVAMQQLNATERLVEIDDRDMPEEMRRFWTRLKEPHCIAGPFIWSSELKEKSKNDVRRAAASFNRMSAQGNAAGAAIAAGFAMASKGAHYWTACGDYRDRIKVWSAEVKSAASANLSALHLEIGEYERDFDLIVPTLNEVSKSPENKELTAVAYLFLKRVCESIENLIGENE